MKYNPQISFGAVSYAYRETGIESFIIICGLKQIDCVDELQKHLEQTHNRLRILYKIDKNIKDFFWMIKDVDGNILFESKGDGSNETISEKIGGDINA